MDYHEFRKILTYFADKPAHVDVERGRLIVEIRDEIIEAKLRLRGGEVRVEEDGTEHPASGWIINRVARMPMGPQSVRRIRRQAPRKRRVVVRSGRRKIRR